MKITTEQQKFLDSLVCERLTANPENEKIINSFVSIRHIGKNLIVDVKNSGFEEDQSGDIAYYIIKDESNTGYCFFSLKCGSMFDPSCDNDIRARIRRCSDALERIRDNDQCKSPEERQELLAKICSTWGISQDQIDYDFDGEVNETSIENKLRYNEEQLPDNQKLLRVTTTHAGVELVHFCANDYARYSWINSGISRPMGEVLFWHCIADIILRIQQLVGCKYTYLFAADYSENNNLVNHYQEFMNFHELDSLGTSLPEYDIGCTFMCQEINELKKHKEYYFEHFNPDIGDELV